MVFLFSREGRREIHLEQNEEGAAVNSLFVARDLVHSEALTLHSFNSARRHDLVDWDRQLAAIERDHFNWLALDHIQQRAFMSVKQIEVALTLEKFRVVAFAGNQFEIDDQVGRLLFRLFVTFALVGEHLRLEHAWLNDNINF